MILALIKTVAISRGGVELPYPPPQHMLLYVVPRIN